MGLRFLCLALLCCACSDPVAAPPPLVPTDAPPAPSFSGQQRPPVRSFESKTIGGDRYPLNKPPGPADAPARSDVWAPTPQFGNKNPNPTSPGTPQFGDLNPNPPSTGTPRYGDLNPSPPGR